MSRSDPALFGDHPERDHPDASLKQRAVRVDESSKEGPDRPITMLTIFLSKKFKPDRPAWVVRGGGGVHHADQSRVEAV